MKSKLITVQTPLVNHKCDNDPANISKFCDKLQIKGEVSCR